MLTEMKMGTVQEIHHTSGRDDTRRTGAAVGRQGWMKRQGCRMIPLKCKLLRNEKHNQYGYVTLFKGVPICYCVCSDHIL
jgi:hypothetical protein